MSKWLSLLCALPALCMASDYAVQGASVHTMTGGGSLGQNLTILVSDGRVRAIGEGLAVPDGYEVIDAAGKVVTPGLIDAHTQLGLVEIGLEATTRDDAVSSYPLGPALDAADAFNGNSTLFAVNRRDGITRAVTAPIPGNDPFAGWGALVRLTDSQQIFDTRVAMFGSLVIDRWTGGSRAAVIQRVREGLLGARKLSPRRRDVREYRPADREALNALLTSRAPLVLEVHRSADIERAVRLAEDFDLQLVVLGGSEAWRVADLLAERDVPVVLDVLGNLPRRFDRLGARLDNAALLQAAGVTVIFTSEQTQNARWIRQGAGNAVAAGLPYDAALAAITRNPALTFGFPPGVGQIVVGGVADLVVWSGDPLEVSTWAERVMIDGEWQRMETRQTRLLERYRDLDARGLGFGYR